MPKPFIAAPHLQEFTNIPKGTEVKFDTGGTAITTGGTRKCSCGHGIRLGVRHADGSVRWICSKTITQKLVLEVNTQEYTNP